jgi:hypothetical protein
MIRLRRILAGIAALASLTALLFLLLRWRTSSPEEHINLNGAGESQPSEQSDE